MMTDERVERLREELREYFLRGIENAKATIAHAQARIDIYEHELSGIGSWTEAEMRKSASLLKAGAELDYSAQRQLDMRWRVAAAYDAMEEASAKDEIAPAEEGVERDG